MLVVLRCVASTSPNSLIYPLFYEQIGTQLELGELRGLQKCLHLMHAEIQKHILPLA